jgi:hypothetical protein
MKLVKAAVVAAVAGLAVSACSTTQMGAAAITGNSRITATQLTSQVQNLNTAYAADKAKGISPQRAVSQETQQVLTWLILFRVYDKMAQQHNITVTQTEQQQSLAQYTSEAKQNNVTLQQYWSAGGALPPDLLPELGQAGAIQLQLIKQLNGGKTPTTQAEEAAVDSQLDHQQCLAAKSLGITVNPQFGVYNYDGLTVALEPPTLAANPTPSPASSVQLTPHC